LTGHEESRFLPRVAITMGDVAGIGPEIIARCWGNHELTRLCRPIVVGHPAVLARALALVGSGMAVLEMEGLEDAPSDMAAIPCWNPTNDAVLAVPPATTDARAGLAAYQYVAAAAGAACAQALDAVVTAPINKAALAAAGFDEPGHTEILARLCGAPEFAMMLHLPGQRACGLSVAHVTLHTSLRSVPSLVSAAGVEQKIRLVDQFLKQLGCLQPRIAVCALNPHAGEEGLMGDEEPRHIAPAVAAARAAGILAVGPLPADTVFRRACDGQFDGVVAMYHDQGHIALKLLGAGKAVNVTLGLPIVRTSPSHGTAYDIAWKGQARADGLFEAVRLAVCLAVRKQASCQATTRC
jgi:4-hydroxythreonine-4-phosphate dehydrogenase